MPKFMLTIQAETIAELMTYLAPSGGALALASVTAPGPADDDENAPLNATAPGLDSAGLPWDARIHAAAKSLNKDGTWRAKRGADEATIAAVTAELRAQQSQPTQFAPMNPQPVQAPQQFAAPPVQPVQPMQPAPGQFTPPPAGNFAPPPAYVEPVQAFQPPPMQQAQPAPLDFATFMGGIQRGMMTASPNGQPFIDQPYLVNLTARLSQHIGRPLNAITDIHADAAAIAIAADMVKQDGRWV